MFVEGKAGALGTDGVETAGVVGVVTSGKVGCVGLVTSGTGAAGVLTLDTGSRTGNGGSAG